MKGEEIQNRIFQYLKLQEWPSTTEDVAKSVGISWNTAELHLTKLQMQSKVKYRKVGRQNQWWHNKSYKANIK
jgi:predicted transcriptional regulator